jgi:hypothetical protein
VGPHPPGNNGGVHLREPTRGSGDQISMLEVAAQSGYEERAQKVRFGSRRRINRQAIDNKNLAISWKLSLALLCLCGFVAPGLRADVPPLLAKAIQRWSAGNGDLAFTQETKRLQSDGGVKDDRVERFDPSLPDSRRWRLIEVNGQPATQDQKRKWESRKNGKPRRRVDESPAGFLDLDHSVLLGESRAAARFQVPLLPSAQHLVAVSGIDVVITVDRRTQNIARIGAVLREPIHAPLGLAEITDLDVDLKINPADVGSAESADEVLPGSSARVRMSRLGKPVEYAWSDFKRVATFAGPDLRNR